MADRFVSRCPPPDAREQQWLELLSVHAEEICSLCGAISNHGSAAVERGREDTLRQRLSREVGGLLEVIGQAEADDVLLTDVMAHERPVRQAQIKQLFTVFEPGSGWHLLDDDETDVLPECGERVEVMDLSGRTWICRYWLDPGFDLLGRVAWRPAPPETADG